MASPPPPSTPSSSAKLSAHLAKFAYTPPRANATSSRSSPLRNAAAATTTASPSPNAQASSSRKRRAPLGPADPFREEPEEDVKPVLTPSRSKRQRVEPEDGSPARRSPRAAGSGTPPRRIPRGYAEPETYAHLGGLDDRLEEGLRVVFCGINPGRLSAKTGHHYANPSNRFWKMMHQSGFTDRLYKPEEGKFLPERFRIGLTNLVERPTAEQSELSRLEQRLEVPTLLAKVQKYQPLAVCFVGKMIGDIFEGVVGKSLSARNEEEEEVDVEEGLVKMEEEEEDELVAATPEIAAAREGAVVAAAEAELAKGKPRFRWEDPRPYKYVHEKGRPGVKEKVTLFWTMPSTSGLERTLMPDRVAYASAMREAIEQLEAGKLDTKRFKAIDIAGIGAVITEMKRKAATSSTR